MIKYREKITCLKKRSCKDIQKILEVPDFMFPQDSLVILVKQFEDAFQPLVWTVCLVILVVSDEVSETHGRFKKKF